MKPLSDAEKIMFLLSYFALESGERTALQRLRAAIGLCRTTIYDVLKTGTNLGKASRERLDEAVRSKLVEPGSAAYQKLYAEVRRALGEENSGLPDMDRLASYLAPLAYFVWAAMALDKALPPAQRLLYGRIAQRVLSDWLKHGSRRTEAEEHFKVADSAVVARGLEVVDAMMTILIANPKPPTDFFTGPTESSTARWNGYRLFCATFASDYLYWKTQSPGLTEETRSGMLADAYRNGIHHHMVWFASIRTEEIGWRYNPWSLSMHRGDWRESVKLAIPLFARFDILTNSVSGLKPVKDDREMWPAVAAILEDEDHPELDGLRKLLNSGDPQFSEMMSCMDNARKRVAGKNTYADVLDAFQEDQMTSKAMSHKGAVSATLLFLAAVFGFGSVDHGIRTSSAIDVQVAAADWRVIGGKTVAETQLGGRLGAPAIVLAARDWRVIG